MMRSPDFIRVAPKAWIGESPILVPVASSAALILQRRSLGLIFANGSVESGTLITTLEDLNLFIKRFEGGFLGADNGSTGGRLDLTVFAHELSGLAGRGWIDGGFCGSA